MISALDRMVVAQQRLISDISHELRTPLTRLQLATALMRRRHGEGKELERIEMEAQRLDSMINDLLVLSRSQHKNELHREPIKANELWSDVLENAQFEADQMGKTLEVTAPPGPWALFGNPAALDSALENIVRNALRYSHHHIAVAFSSDNQGITITVDDDGPGVSQKTVNRYSDHSTALIKREIVSLAGQVWDWLLWKQRLINIAVGCEPKTAH